MIPTRNIYYMLAYAFQSLQAREYAACGSEAFDNTAGLLAAILAKGVSQQVKRGLQHGYISQTEQLSAPRGKIDLAASLKRKSLLKRQLVCQRDEFLPDTRLNQILKSTIQALLKADIAARQKSELRVLLVYFQTVRFVPAYRIHWHERFDRSSRTYEALVFICYLVLKGLLPDAQSGQQKMQLFLDEQRASHLYEKFILGYYQREHPELHPASSFIRWNLGGAPAGLLPVMHSDVMLRAADTGRTLILDAKYYAHMTQTRFDVHTLHSHNLYQIFTYVKNQDVAHTGKVSGMLLYARTDEEIVPDSDFCIDGNPIHVKALDLNQPFEAIAAQLEAFVEPLKM